ncbi:hypothetical protein F2P79_025687, partial [Pimephales promelas]
MSTTPTSLDGELMSIISKAVAEMGLKWSVPEQPVKKRMDWYSLHVGRQLNAQQRPAPFFSELHHELTQYRCYDTAMSPCPRNPPTFG